MIYVTGGGGFVSREIVRGLVRAGQQARVLVANPEEAQAAADLSAQVVVGDRRQPATFAHTLEGISTALLLTRNAQDLVEMDAKFNQAAKSAGVDGSGLSGHGQRQLERLLRAVADAAGP